MQTNSTLYSRSGFAKYTALSLTLWTVLCFVPLSSQAQTVDSAADTWSSHGGAGGAQYSSLAQIAPDNLDTLELAWTYRSGELGADFKDSSFSFQANPVVWNNTVYFSTATGLAVAVDARTGQVLWSWDPIPRTTAAAPGGELDNNWADGSATITGSANAWAPLSADPELGLVFVPTSSPSPDFYGGERIGDNRYANSLVALSAETGAVVWHQQLVHHDVWDYDTPMQPSLTLIDVNGTPTRAVAVVGKTAMLYAFDRATGEPLVKLEERRVPASDVPGEALSPTQPFSSFPPLTSHAPLTEDDAFGLLWFDKRACVKILNSFRSEGVFTPPSLRGTLQYPGYAGGANWGGVAIDPERQIAVTNVMQLPGLVRLIPRDEFDAVYASGELDDWQISQQTGTPYLMARRIFLSPLGMPCIKPPWGKLVALDLRAGKILWNEPLGTIEDIAPAPVPNFKWGVPNMGGAILTASGLVVIGSAADFYLRIFDVSTGKELWKTRLPTAAHATPATFEVNNKQYIVAAVGGHSEFGSPPGDYLMAWRLKD